MDRLFRKSNAIYMKKRLLPLGYIILTIAAASFFLALSNPGDDKPFARQEPATDHLSLVRANQHTGVINPADYLKAVNQAGQQSTRSGQAYDFNWQLLGPNNLGGKTRAILFDNRDQSGMTMFAGSVMGGMFKSDNGGAKWFRIDNGNGNMFVSCITQDGSGTIYAGTGDGFIMKDSTVLSSWGYSTGFIGQGIFKSTDGETFNLLPATKPMLNGNDELEWGFINELAAHPSNGELFAATNTGLKYTGDGGNTWRNAKTAEGTELNISSKDVKMAANGLVIADCPGSANQSPSIYGLDVDNHRWIMLLDWYLFLPGSKI